MKILFISSHHGIGASESLWIDTACHLAKAGHQVSALVNWKIKSTSRAAPLVKSGIPFRFINPKGTANALGRLIERFIPFGVLELSRVRSAIAGIKPDMIVFSEGNDISALPFMELAMNSCVPFTVVTHGVNPAEWPNDKIAPSLRKAFTEAAHTFWVASRNIEEFEYHIGSRLPNASVVRNPVKLSRATPFAWPDDAGSLRMACVARMQARPKGHDLLLRALADARWNNLPIHLSFFGDGENRVGMENLARLLGIEGRVQFHKHVEDIASIWKDHHIIAQPSRNEGMPLSLVEALMCGRPAFVTDVAGHTELITEGENGFIADAPTVNSLQDCLERIWNSRDQLMAMGRRAYDRIREDIPEDPAVSFAQDILSVAAKRKV